LRIVRCGLGMASVFFQSRTPSVTYVLKTQSLTDVPSMPLHSAIRIPQSAFHLRL
jgi:hypothetical protein